MKPILPRGTFRPERHRPLLTASAAGEPGPPVPRGRGRLLILGKHSLPEIEPDVPANKWRLGDEGRNRCMALADRLAPYHPSAVVTSQEPKAVETGAMLALRLNLPVRSAPGLHEHDRRDVGFLEDAAFAKRVAHFFARRNELVFGWETGNQAQQRFTGAINQVLSDRSDGNPVIVPHGTVISLFVAAHADVEPFDLWQRLGLPSFVVLRLPHYRLVAAVERLDFRPHRGRACDRTASSTPAG